MPQGTPLDNETLRVLFILASVIGGALVTISKLVDIAIAKKKGNGYINLDPVVEAMRELKEEMRSGTQATEKLLSSISDGQERIATVLASTDPELGIPRVFCLSKQSLERATTGPLREINEGVKEILRQKRKES